MRLRLAQEFERWLLVIVNWVSGGRRSDGGLVGGWGGMGLGWTGGSMSFY